MSFSWSLVVVAGAVVIAAFFAIVFGGSERKQLMLQVLIVVASTFSGVFLGLGLDKIKNDREDRDLAAAYLRTAIVSFVEQMRPWHQEARGFPKVALTTPDPDQRRILLEKFAKYMPKTVLQDVTIENLSDPKITKNFDEFFLILMNQSEIHMGQANSILRSESASLAERYGSLHRILELSSGIYGLMCMQASLLNDNIGQADFDAYLSASLSAERANQIGCFEPQWGAAALIRNILRQAATAGAKPFEQIQLNPPKPK